MPAYPNTLIYGRTADGENVPVLVEADGTVVTTGGGGGGTPGGSDTQLQYNNAGAFGGVPATWTAVGTKLELAGGFEATGGAGSYAGYPAALVVDTDSSLNWQLVITDPGAPDAFGIYSFSSGAFGFQSEDYATTGTSLTFGPNGMLVESNSRGTGAIAGKVLFAGRNMSGSGAAGALGLNNRLGTTRYVWADATDTLRVGSAMPTEDGSVSDTSGSALVLSTGPTLTAPVGITGVVGSSALTITGATQTASFPALNITQTWNNAAVTFTGVNVNVTNSASAAASRLLSLQLGGSDLYTFARDGQFKMIDPASANNYMRLSATGTVWNTNAVGIMFQVSEALVSSGAAVQVGALGTFSWRTTNRVDAGSVGTLLAQDSAGVLAQRNSTNAQTQVWANTWTNATNYEYGRAMWSSNVWHIGTTNAGTGTARVLQLDYGGTTTAAISVPITSGDVTIGGAVKVTSATMIKTATSFTDGAAAQAGTLTNAPAAGNPTKWIPIDDNGTTRYIPAW